LRKKHSGELKIKWEVNADRILVHKTTEGEMRNAK
jgi:hypothetical protein